MSSSNHNIQSGPKSRRDFLRLSGRVAAASALAGVAAHKAYAAEDSTIKLALVGCGGRGTGAVADAFSTKGGPVKLYAMADLFEDRLKSSLGNLKQGSADKVEHGAMLVNGSGETLKEIVAAAKKVSDVVADIAKVKLPDLNAIDLEGAKKIIAGTARSMGVDAVS